MTHQQGWEWKVEALAGYGDDPDIIDVSFFGDFRSANLAAQEQRPARVGLVKAGSPETVFYIRPGMANSTRKPRPDSVAKLKGT